MTYLLTEHSVTALDVVHHADALAWLRGAPSNWLNCVVTSPPFYGLRDYNAPIPALCPPEKRKGHVEGISHPEA